MWDRKIPNAQVAARPSRAHLKFLVCVIIFLLSSIIYRVNAILREGVHGLSAHLLLFSDVFFIVLALDLTGALDRIWPFRQAQWKKGFLIALGWLALLAMLWNLARELYWVI